jgi:hypothetical protein
MNRMLVFATKFVAMATSGVVVEGRIEAGKWRESVQNRTTIVTCEVARWVLRGFAKEIAYHE